LEGRLAPAVLTWDGGGSDNNWTTAANWVGDVAPVAGADLVFTGRVGTTPNNDFAAGTAFSSITFTNGGFTLTGNAVTLTGTSGGGIFNAIPLTINNSIVANSAGGNIMLFPLGTLSGSHNLIEDGSGGLPDTITGDPMLGSLANNGGPTQTFAPLTGSPAIDAGSDALAVDTQGNPLTTDQRGPGYARISGAAVDIGAFEVQQGAADLRARVNALRDAGVLSSSRAHSLNAKLNLHGNGGDIGKVRSFLDQVNASFDAAILSEAQAKVLLAAGTNLLMSLRIP
jgi:hypothetical protein